MNRSVWTLETVNKISRCLKSTDKFPEHSSTYVAENMI